MEATSELTHRRPPRAATGSPARQGEARPRPEDNANPLTNNEPAT